MGKNIKTYTDHPRKPNDRRSVELHKRLANIMCLSVKSGNFLSSILNYFSVSSEYVRNYD